MIRNYLTVALRGFRRHKLFTLINIFGLSIGISAALVIYLIVQFEFGFDRFYQGGDNIYRVVTNSLSPSGEQSYNGGVVGALPQAVRNSVTGITGSAPFFIVDEFALNRSGVTIPGAVKAPLKFKYKEDMVLVDERYFDMFPYKWLAGSKQSLNEPFTVTITADKAKKYYPSLSFADILGKQVIYGDSIKTIIIGIVEAHKTNTDFNFSDFISYSTSSHVAALRENMQQSEWGGVTPSSQFFVKLSDNSSVANVEKQINQLFKRNDPNAGKGNTFEMRLEKLSDIHFNDRYASFYTRTANKTTLYGLMAIGIFLLLLACINFVNLATAQASQRAKEIGIRKTMGGSRVQLMLQYLSETFLLTFCAVIISVLFAPIILQAFADLIPAGVNADLLSHSGIAIFLILLTITVSLASGFYPALILSGYKPALVLKNQTTGKTGRTRNATLRKFLTVIQFVIAQFFIVSTLFVGRQIYFVLHKDLGFKKEAVLSVSTPLNAKDAGLKQVYMNALKNLPQVENISMGGASPSSDNTHSTPITFTNGKTEIKTGVQERFGDENYRRVYGIKLLAGRDLQSNDVGKGFLINRMFAKALGFENPADAVGSMLNYSGRKMQVIGVVGDFYYRSLHSPIMPLVIVTRSDNNYFSSTLHISLRPRTVGGDEWKKALAGMQAAWKAVYPDDVFQYQFFDESIAKFYESEQHTSELLSWAMGLSIVISCLGLLGLAVYTTTQRRKEIAVRKVLGASVAQIVALLCDELVKLVLLSFVIVTPLAWWALNNWMQDFVDRIPLSWWIFALGGIGILLASLITSGFQTLKAAVSNPAKSLKAE